MSVRGLFGPPLSMDRRMFPTPGQLDAAYQCFPSTSEQFKNSGTGDTSTPTTSHGHKGPRCTTKITLLTFVATDS